MKLFTSDTDKTPLYKAVLNLLLASILIVFLFLLVLSQVGIAFDFSFVSRYSVRLLDGFLMTIYISIFSLILSLILGILAAVMQSCKVLIVRYLAKIYVTVIRGTPLIMQIYLGYYLVGTAIGIEDRFLSAVVILSVFEGAYISEIIRGSLLSIDNTQRDAAAAVGFTKMQTTRYVLLPQLVARTLPALTRQFASIIKDSSLLSIIAVIEITQTIKEITAFELNLFEGYFILGLLYLILTLPISLLSKRIERRFNFENRNR